MARVSYPGGFYIPLVISGFKEDMMAFVDKLEGLYEEDGEKTLAQFVKVWREMKFSLVFTGRLFFRELYEFIENALKLTKDFVVHEKQYPRRCALMFLLYGLHLKQPARPKVNVKLTLTDLKSFLALMNECNENGDYNVTYIFFKLLEHHAFLYVACDDPVGLEVSLKSAKEEIIGKDSNFLPDLERLSEKIMSVKALNNRYAFLKKNLDCSAMDSEDRASLKVVSKKYPDRMLKMLFPQQKEGHQPESMTPLKPENDVGERRKAIKERSSWGISNEFRGYKFEVDDVNQIVSETESGPRFEPAQGSSSKSKRLRKEYPYDEAKQRETESIYDEFYGNLGLKQDPTLEDLAGDNLDTGEETHPNQ